MARKAINVLVDMTLRDSDRTMSTNLLSDQDHSLYTHSVHVAVLSMILGKALGVPVWELLGGKMRDRIWTYGRWDGATPELAVERAMGFVEQGLTALKGDPFDHTGIFLQRDAERHAIAKMKAVREAVGDDVELLLEVHGRLAPASAIHMANEIEEYRPFVMEEPVPPQNIDALQRVAEAVNVPLATGERLFTKWDYTDLLQRQIVAMIQPDIVQAGGIMELKKIAAMAEAHYVGFQPHNPYGPICTAAALQLDACTPNFMIQEGGLHPWFQDATSGMAPIQKDGFFDLPELPGLGVDLNEEWLAANPWDPNGAVWRATDGSPVTGWGGMGSLQETYWS